MSDLGATRALPATTDEFLAWPGDGWVKHCELVDGEIRDMLPASALHGVLQLTLGASIRQHRRESGSRCSVLTEPAVKPDLRAAIKARGTLRLECIGLACPIEAVYADTPLVEM